MPALTGSTFGVLKPPKLPTVSTILNGYKPAPVTVSPPTSGGYLPIPKQARDPYNLVGVEPQAGPFPESFPAGGSASAADPFYQDTPPPYTAPIYTETGAPTIPQVPTNPGAVYTPPPATRDYTWDINNDPLYSQWLNFTKPGLLSQYAGDRKQQTDAALQQFGEIPDLTGAIKGFGLDPNSDMYKMLFGDIDQPTRDAAKQLTDAGLSTVAGLNRSHATDVQSLLDQLAARGTVQSGATGVGLGQADQTASQNQYAARSSLLNYLTGVQHAFNQSVQGLNQQQATEASNAAQRQIAMIPQIGSV